MARVPRLTVSSTLGGFLAGVAQLYPTQEAVIAFLRRRSPEARPLFFLTRSNAILDLGPSDAPTPRH